MIYNVSRREALSSLAILPIITLSGCFDKDGGMTQSPINILDIIPKSLHDAITNYTSTADVTIYFQQAAIAANAGQIAGEARGGTVFVPNGLYRIGSVGIRDTCFLGESRGGTILRALSPGYASQFMLDAMLDRDGATKNTRGRGWAERLTIDAFDTGRSCLRVYGGGVSCRDLWLTNGNYGLAAGLPMWSSFSNIHSEKNNVGFYTFHDVTGDIGTSATFSNCWADTCKTYGFHISQLAYSSFISCVAQDCGVNNWYIQGDLNGVPAVYSLIFLTCASEGSGVPYYLRKVRDLTMINPRIIGSPSTDFMILDDAQGSIRDFSTVASPIANCFHLKVISHTSDLGSILIDNCTVTHPPDQSKYFTVSGAVVNGVRRTVNIEHRWNALTNVEKISAKITNIDGYSGLSFQDGDGNRIASFRRTGTPVFKTGGAINDPASNLQAGDISFYVEGQNIRFMMKDFNGQIRSGIMPTT